LQQNLDIVVARTIALVNRITPNQSEMTAATSERSKGKPHVPSPFLEFGFLPAARDAAVPRDLA
jgi:hypothetical protein